MNLTIQFLAIVLAVTTQAAEPDIIEQTAAHPRGKESVKQPDGTWNESKYGDHKLEEAEAFLSAKYPRPWTVTATLMRLQSVTDDKSRVCLLRLLAASRDPRAALVLGASIDSESLDVRIAACYGLLDYFVIADTAGGTEQHFKVAKDWFASNKTRLQKEAATK